MVAQLRFGTPADRIRLDGVNRTGTGVAKTGDKGTAVIITLDPLA